MGFGGFSHWGERKCHCDNSRGTVGADPPNLPNPPAVAKQHGSIFRAACLAVANRLRPELSQFLGVALALAQGGNTAIGELTKTKKTVRRVDRACILSKACPRSRVGTHV